MQTLTYQNIRHIKEKSSYNRKMRNRFHPKLKHTSSRSSTSYDSIDSDDAVKYNDTNSKGGIVLVLDEEGIMTKSHTYQSRQIMSTVSSMSLSVTTMTDVTEPASAPSKIHSENPKNRDEVSSSIHHRCRFHHHYRRIIIIYHFKN
jgi:hypothetical protein